MTQAIAVKERPILFSSEMVRAILEGRKTQTRRVIKPQPEWFPHDEVLAYDDLVNKGIKCPYGQANDLLWVRETWRLSSWDNDFCDARLEYRANGEKRWVETGDLWECPDVKWESLSKKLIQRNVFRDPDGHFLWDGECPVPWEPSIFMPRAASRIKLRVTEVKVERVQDISFKDCRAEGCSEAYLQVAESCSHEECSGRHYGEKWHFRKLWDSINTERGYGWDVNPWVWVVGFEKVSGVAS